MTAATQRTHRKGSWLTASLAVAGALVASQAQGQAQGQDYRPQRNPADASQCAVYGSDYVAVYGGSTCVRIGGRVRVEYETRGAVGHAYAPAPGQSAFPPSNGDGLNRAHLKLDPHSRR